MVTLVGMTTDWSPVAKKTFLEIAVREVGRIALSMLPQNKKADSPK